jgi:hypothetical protein
MSTNVHHHINYVELPSTDLDAVQAFYAAAFGWTFQVWGDTYRSFTGAGLEGGFELQGASTTSRAPSGDGVLVILYSDDLAATQAAVVAAGGTVSVPPYDFPGGRRFHFVDPSGNELAVWTPSEPTD